MRILNTVKCVFKSVHLIAQSWPHETGGLYIQFNSTKNSPHWNISMTCKIHVRTCTVIGEYRIIAFPLHTFVHDAYIMHYRYFDRTYMYLKKRSGTPNINLCV